MQKKIIFIIILLSFFSLKIFSQTNFAKKPKIVVQIVVEQMRYDYITRYWNKFGNEGFKKLINEGTVCHNAKYDYLITSSSSGYATIATGTTPSYHGIVADTWYQRLKESETTSIYDANEQTIGANLFENIGKSPRQLETSTWSDELKMSDYKQSKVISISLNDESAILAGGLLANAAYWLDAEDGKWVSSTYYFDAVPQWVNDFNDKQITELYLARPWTTLLDLGNYTESLADGNTYELGFKSGNQFPYDLTALKGIYGSYDILKYTPYGNTFTKDFAINTIIEENLGKGEYTDFLAIGFSASNNISDIFGIRSVEIEDTYLRLDNDIAHLLSTLEDTFGKDEFLIYLTADRGATDDPLYLNAIEMKGSYFNTESAMTILNSYLKATYGVGEWVQFYYQNQIYLNQSLIESSELSLADVQNKAADFMVQFTGIANAVSATSLQTNSFTEGIFSKIQNSFSQKKSGDVFIVFTPGWIGNPKTVNDLSISAQISPFNNNLHVPLIWYGCNIDKKQIYRNIKIEDIATTMSSILNVSQPNAATGTLIYELFE